MNKRQKTLFIGPWVGEFRMGIVLLGGVYTQTS